MKWIEIHRKWSGKVWLRYFFKSMFFLRNALTKETFRYLKLIHLSLAVHLSSRRYLLNLLQNRSMVLQNRTYRCDKVENLNLIRFPLFPFIWLGTFMPESKAWNGVIYWLKLHRRPINIAMWHLNSSSYHDKNVCMNEKSWSEWWWEAIVRDIKRDRMNAIKSTLNNTQRQYSSLRQVLRL